jgi:hypothetical protein
MLLVMFHVFVVNEYVMKEHKNKLPKIRGKNRVHQSLKCVWYIGKTKRHDQKCKMSKVSLEWSQSFILI